MSEYDLIVVGGGPAGVITAFTVRKAGKKVLILDRKTHDQIGNKTCGDALDLESPTLLHQELGIDMPSGEEVSDDLTKLTVASKSKSLTFTAPGYTVDRHIYGQRLLQDCLDIGVELISKSVVRELIIEDNFLVGVKYLKGGKLTEVRSKVVADCSGTQAVVRNRLPENFSFGLQKSLPDHHIAVTFREIVTLKKDHKYMNEIVLLYENDIPPPGYLWFFSKGKRRLNIGTGWLKSENDYPQGMKAIYRKALDKHYSRDEYEINTAGGGQIPIRPPYDSLTFNGGVVVGDAGCLVDPTTAEGHGPALICGFYAGRAIVEAIDKDDVSREGLWKYNTDTMAHYGKKNAVSYVNLSFLRDLTGKGIDFVLRRRLLTTNDLDLILHGGDIHLGFFDILARIIRAFPRFGILLRMKKLVEGVEAIDKLYKKYPSDPKDLPNWVSKRNIIFNEEL